MATDTTPDPTLRTSRKDRRRAIVSSFLGSTVEYYDFLLYGAAAGLVFPQLFFTDLDRTTGLLLSYLTLFTGYVSRPIGGMLFGHFGDKFGRKNMLFITLMMMGLVSVAIGLMPTAATIGIAAPIILVLLRVVQGLAVGGEWAGATLMAMEHSKHGSRGLGASIAVAGGPTGSVLATLILGLFAALPDESFYAWGWRVPFLLSAVLVVIGLYMRFRVTESPDFQAAKEAGEVHTGVPLFNLFRRYPRELITGSLAGAAALFIQGLLAIWMVPYVVASGALTRETALYMLTASSVVHIFTIPFFAWLSDRLGRRVVMMGGAIFSIAAIWPMFAMFNSGSPVLIGLAFLLGNPLIQASMYGPIGAYLSEMFDTTSRYTGVSVTFQLGAVIGSGTAAIVANRLVTPEAGTTYLAWWIVGLYVISGLAVLFSHPGRRRRQDHATRFEESHLLEG